MKKKEKKKRKRLKAKMRKAEKCQASYNETLRWLFLG